MKEKKTEEQIKETLIRIINLVETLPNNYELGEKVRRIYYEDLKNMKEKI